MIALGITGRSGCGKSTLAKLLFQYYPDYSGDILFNGRQVRTLDRTALYRRVGYIAQTAYLFHDTIRNNICLHEDFPDEQLAHAIAAAGLTDWVASLPDGLDTVISEEDVAASASASASPGWPCAAMTSSLRTRSLPAWTLTPASR